MFNVKSLNETKEIIKSSFFNYPLKTKMVRTADSLGLVIAKDIYSTLDLPHFNRSTVDGYAVKYDDVKMASASSPAILKIVDEVFMGKEATRSLNPSEAIIIPTGGHVPAGSDAVVMIETTQLLKDEVLVYKNVSKYDNIIRLGSDIQKDTLLIKKNKLVTPQVIGALMSQNIREIVCYKKLSATIISTGDEIVDNEEEQKVGVVQDINTYTISNYLKLNNVEITATTIVQDDYNKYKDSILNGFEDSDIVVSSGGSSVGEKDYTDRILHELGATILIHGLNVKPGKPTIIAIYKDKLFLGLPGHPTSAFVVLRLLLQDFLNSIQNTTSFGEMYLEARLLENVANNSGRTLIQLVELIEQDSVLYAKPLHTKSAMISTIKNADGFIIIDQFQEGIYKEDIVKVYK